MTEQLTERLTGTIHYGFGKEYLPKWGIAESLREIYQNFIDYGEYSEETIITGDKISVKLTNGWMPETLEYLRIGNSRKDNPNAIGHHGEGLKMAFLILLRSGFISMIFTNRYAVYPEWYNDNEIGDCFCFNYEVHDFYESPYTLEFECLRADYTAFKANLITPEDIIYSNSYGDIVDKEKGNIYSGGLWVAKVDNMSKAYNIRPEFLPLDRDRSVPRAFDVNWYSSKINDGYGKWTAQDTAYSDTVYLESVPAEILPQFKARKIGNDIQFTYRDENNKDQVVKNDSIVQALKRDSFFAAAIKRLKKLLAKQIGIYELLLAFQKKHVHGVDAKQDFQVILDRIEK